MGNLTHEQKETVALIRDKYENKSCVETDFEKLKRIDSETTKKGTVVSISVGLIGTLILGLGMSLIMVWDKMILGLIIGLIGGAGICFAFPIYSKITAYQRKIVAEEIMRLSDELLDE